jgi:hypothetical protein
MTTENSFSLYIRIYSYIYVVICTISLDKDVDM